MTYFLDRRDYWGNRLSVWVVVLMGFLAPICWWSLKQIRFEDNLTGWLSSTNPEMLANRWMDEQFPSHDQVLLTWDDSSINDSRINQVVDRLIGQIDDQGGRHGGNPYTASVIDPVQKLKSMQRNGIEPSEAVRRLVGTVLGVGPLKLRLTEAGRSSLRKTKHEIQTAFESVHKIAVTILEPTPDLSSLTSIPAAEGSESPSPPVILTIEGQIAEIAKTDHDLQITWNGLQIGSEKTISIVNWLTKYIPARGAEEPLVENAFFAPGAPIALTIGISEAGLADKKEAVTAIRAACNDVGIASESVHMCGSIVSESELNNELFKSAWNPNHAFSSIQQRSPIISSLLIAAILTFAFLRRIGRATILVTTSVLALFSAMSIMSVSGGTIGLFQIALPTLIFAWAVSLSLQLNNHLRFGEINDGLSSIGRVASAAWMPCYLASLCAVIGYLSLCTSNVNPIREFGFYGAAGVGLSLALVTIVLPSLVQLLGEAPAKLQEDAGSSWRMLGQFLVVRSGLQSYALIAICIGCGVGLTRFRAETGLETLASGQSKMTRDRSYVETNLAGSMPLETIVRFDQQSQKDTNFLDRMEIVRKIEEKLRQHPLITGTTSVADFLPVSELAPEEASFLQKNKFNKRASAIEQRFHDGEFQESRAFLAKSNGAIQGPFGKPDDELWRITAQSITTTEHDLPSILADVDRIAKDGLKLHPGTDHIIAGPIPILLQIRKAIIQTLNTSCGLACALTLGLFVISLRSFGGAILAIIPGVASVAVVFGAVSWTKHAIGSGSIIAAPVAFGIAGAGTMCYLTWARMLMRKGMTRPEAMIESLALSGSAIWQCGAIGAIALAVLAQSDLPQVSDFGWMAASIVGVSTLCNTVLLPLLFAGPLGGLLESAKPILADTVTLDTAAISSNVQLQPEDILIPEPQIKPHDPTTKKRRSSSRRDRDAG